MVRPKRKCSDEERKQKQRETVKRFREKIRNNSNKYEEAKRNERERYYNRKEVGKIKSISQMSYRERSQQRKEWRERSKRCYDRKKEGKLVHQRLEENNAPPTPHPMLDEVHQEDRRLRQGKLKIRVHLRKLNNKIAELTQQLAKEKKKSIECD
ncbi:unnamed protein product [Psylliodes chrysocephalus]|uniref:Uncharacterized protein n=1 Tax=Psylliodes chrysocephalus TaxID=3402493 RepID=A0A9P0GI19_9CUCU|nr:unnamed protein product [Psylliodes chrysocephala]